MPYHVERPNPDPGEAADRLGAPGSFPFTRGIHPTMYRGRLWTMRQYAGFGTAAESNRRYRYLLDQGVTGLSVAFDLPTQIGYDSDHPLAAGEVGRVGVAIDSLEDMSRLFDGIPLDRVSTSMTINATAIILLALYVAAGRRQGVDTRGLAGTVQNDILKEYVARGTYIYPPRASLRVVTDVVSFCEQELPRWHPISISGYHIREAGSTAAQEIAFTFAHAQAYVQAALDRGLDVDSFGSRLSFFFNAHNDFLEEIAKFRAARRLWATLMRDRFGATAPRAQQLRFHTQTAGSTLTAQQPENNIVRVALQALAAVLGGTQSLHCNGRDEALGLPTEEAAQIALRTQQIIAGETGVTDTVDPVGGAWTIEALTDRLEAEAVSLLGRIDERGGVLAAIESGFIQAEIQEAAYRAQQAVDAGDAVVVGVNRFAAEETAPIETHRIDPQIEADQAASVGALRAARDPEAPRTALAAVERAARDGTNLVPPDHRGRRGAGHRRRDLRHAARRLRRVPGRQLLGDHGSSGGGRRRVVQCYRPVPDLDHPVGVPSHFRLVGDEHDRVAPAVQPFEHRHDLDAGLGVEVARGLVGQHEGRVVHQRAGYRHPLALPPGELVRPVAHPIVELDQAERGGSPLVPGRRRHTGIDQGQLDVVQRGSPRQQVERLEDEPDLLIPDAREVVVVHPADVLAVQQVLAPRRRIETADEVHQRRLARPRGSHDGDELAALDVDRHAAQRMDLLRPHPVGLPEIAGVDQRHRLECQVCGPPVSRAGGGTSTTDAVRGPQVPGSPPGDIRSVARNGPASDGRRRGRHDVRASVRRRRGRPPEKEGAQQTAERREDRADDQHDDEPEEDSQRHAGRQRLDELTHLRRHIESADV